MEPSLLGWSRVRQLRRVSLKSSQDPAMAIAVQRGSAMAYLEGYDRAWTVLENQSAEGEAEQQEEEEEEKEKEGECGGAGAGGSRAA